MLATIIFGMINAESVVTSDISRKLKGHFQYVSIESTERRCRRFFFAFSPIAYAFFDALTKHIISRYCVKHCDNKVHISFDHMFVKDRFTFLLFSLRIGKQGIPIWFRCFKGKHNPDAYKTSLIQEGISYCYNLFEGKHYHIIFLADRWFPNIKILKHIDDIGAFYCIRSKSFFTFSYYDSKGALHTSHLRDIKPLKYTSRVFNDAFYTRLNFKTNIVISCSYKTDEPWYLVTNDDTYHAVKNYSYRFGSIECIFKSQKSNRFRLESTNTQKIQHFISLFTLVCIALVWLTIIGCDYSKNKHSYWKYLKIRDVRKHKDNTFTRLYSFFNLGLTIFNRCYDTATDFVLKFNFRLYDA